MDLAPERELDYAGGMNTAFTHQGPRIIVVCGPTGIGKTRTAMDLARRFSGEIVGADSMQIYRYMDIGTAKPTAAEQACVRHHMVDIVDPDAKYDAARYAREAGETAQNLHQKGLAPIVAGGTGLYIKALQFGLFDSRPPDPEYRRHLEQAAEAHGTAYLHTRLAATDPAAAADIHVNDRFHHHPGPEDLPGHRTPHICIAAGASLCPAALCRL